MKSSTILQHLPGSYKNLVIQLPDIEFLVEEVWKQLLTEYNCQKSKPTEFRRNQTVLSVHRDKHYSCGKPGQERTVD